ncbi:hypothetical protein BDR03DRAFT_947940 [Suillus americanus]|nr:hypothetical protein BDR03DRAFT_947940 [Suillus americanus]
MYCWSSTQPPWSLTDLLRHRSKLHRATEPDTQPRSRPLIWTRNILRATCSRGPVHSRQASILMQAPIFFWILGIPLSFIISYASMTAKYEVFDSTKFVTDSPPVYVNISTSASVDSVKCTGRRHLKEETNHSIYLSSVISSPLLTLSFSYCPNR